jgi:hypothetical protein
MTNRLTGRAGPCWHRPSERRHPCNLKRRRALKGRAIAGPHDYEQIPALVERSVLRVKNFFGQTSLGHNSE